VTYDIYFFIFGEKGIFTKYKQKTLVYDLKTNYSIKSIGQKRIDYLGTKAFNSLNINNKKYLRTNYSTNVNIYLKRRASGCHSAVQ